MLFFFCFFLFQTIDQDNESRKRLELAVALAATKKESVAEVTLRNKSNQKKQQVKNPFFYLLFCFLILVENPH